MNDSKRILLLSKEPESFSSKRFKEEAEKAGVELEIVSPFDFYNYLSPNAKGYDRMYQRSEGASKKLKSKDYMAIIPRIAGESVFEFGVSVVKHFNENLNIFSTATEYGIRNCSNKFQNAQLLSKNNIRVPRQILAHQPDDYKELIELVGSLPEIAKLQKGSMGNGVMILETEQAASTSLQSFGKLGSDVILQQKINSGEPANDLRIFVVGSDRKEPKIFAYKRYSLADDFRSNYSLSGSGEKVQITNEEKEMAIKACQVLKMPIAGVDIMRDVDDKNTPYVIEVNSSPGLKGVEKVTEENVAGAIIEYILNNYKKGGKQQTSALTLSDPLLADLQQVEKSAKKADERAQNPYVRDELYWIRKRIKNIQTKLGVFDLLDKI